MTTIKSRIGEPMVEIMRAKNKEIVSNALQLNAILPDTIGVIQTEVWSDLLALLQDVRLERYPDKVWSYDGGQKLIGNILTTLTVYDMLHDDIPEHDHINTIKLQVQGALNDWLRQWNQPNIDQRMKDSTPLRMDQEFERLLAQFECRYNLETEEYQWYDTKNRTWGGKC